MLTFRSLSWKRARRLVRLQAFAALAQASGAAQLLALLLTVGRGRATDAYVVLFSASQVSLSVLVIGTLQPLVLSLPNYSRWSRWLLSGILLNGAVLWGTAAVLLALNYTTAQVVGTTILLTVSGSFGVAATVEAVHHAALGHPEILAGATLTANMLATAFVVAAPGNKISLMCVGLIAGNALTYLYARTRVAHRRRASTNLRAPRSEVIGLLASSGVGAVGPFGLQAVTASYPAGQATLLGFFSRLGAGVIGVGVTAFTNFVTDWTRRDPRPLRLASECLTCAHGLALIGLTVATLLALPTVLCAAVAAVGWVAGSGSQACAARALSVDGRLSVFRRSAIATVPLYIGATLVLAFGPQNAQAYFLALGMIAAAANSIFLWALAWTRPLRTFAALAAVALILESTAVLTHG
jgi:hypothetical protein